MEMNFMARWEYREDRFEFHRWLHGWHVGYLAHIGDRPTLDLRMEKPERARFVSSSDRKPPRGPDAMPEYSARETFTRVVDRGIVVCFHLDLQEMHSHRDGWRAAVAEKLRYMRVYLRRARS